MSPNMESTTQLAVHVATIPRVSLDKTDNVNNVAIVTTDGRASHLVL